jgi:hypothetical protein
MIYLGTTPIDATSSEYAKKQWVQNQGYLTELPSTAATKSDLDASIGALNTSVNTAIGNIEMALDGKYGFTTAGDWTEGGSSVSGKPIHCLSLDKGTWNNGDTTMNTDTYGYTVVHDTAASESIYGDFPISFSATKSYVSGQLSGKQDTLVSGTNIKTVNNQSILGSGNLTIDLTIYRVVQSLPASDIDPNKIYLMLNPDGSTNNAYDEYMYVNDGWEKIGQMGNNIDLTGYLTIANASANFLTIADASTTYVKDSSLDSKVTALNYVKSTTLSDYLLSSTAASTYATKVELEGYVKDASLDSKVTDLGYAKTTAIPTAYSDLTNDTGYKAIVLCTDAEYAALVSGGTVDANTVYLTYTAS